MQLERILLGHDFEPAADSTLEELAVVARAFEAELQLVHAIPEAATTDPAWRSLSEHARDLLGSLRWRELERGVPVSPRLLVAPGEPWRVLLEAAAELQPDLIALGAGRRGVLDRIVLGRTADEVLRRSAWPVWLVRPGRPHAQLRTVLCACDGHPRGEALGAAAALARAFGTSLTVLTVVPPARTGGVRWASEALLHDLAPDLERDGVHVEHLVRQGEATSLIVEAASRAHTDLVVLGSSFRTSAGSLFGASIAERLLRLLPCSLLAVRAPAAITAGV